MKKKVGSPLGFFSLGKLGICPMWCQIIYKKKERKKTKGKERAVVLLVNINVCLFLPV
jgi:hypothetical protein